MKLCDRSWKNCATIVMSTAASEIKKCCTIGKRDDRKLSILDTGNYKSTVSLIEPSFNLSDISVNGEHLCGGKIDTFTLLRTTLY